MKIGSYICICILLHICPYVLGQDCITLSQVMDVIRALCGPQKQNKILWQKVIDCHQPIPEERSSGEAQCPHPKHVEDPTNTSYSIQDVYFNVCGLVEASFFQNVMTYTCFLLGKGVPRVIDHFKEVEIVRKTWGADVPCNIGKCILKLGLHK